jgi:hypothetical protein
LSEAGNKNLVGNMRNLILIIILFVFAFRALCQQKPIIEFHQEKDIYSGTLKRIDSILHTSEKYKSVGKEISDIPMETKRISLIFIDSAGSNGEKLKQDICNYRVGYKKEDMGAPKYIYWIYYSVSSNQIMFLTKKPEDSPYIFKI